MRHFAHIIRSFGTLTTLFLCCIATGCASLTGRDLPESLIVSHDPALGREYLLYRPAAYDRDQAWPLVVACHGGFGDSPKVQIKLWRELADKYGFLVAAPRLLSGGKAEKLPDDERHLLSVLDHVRAGQSISDDRVLMYGQGPGAFPALVTALGAPDVFRTVALADPRFRVEDLTATNRALDPYQPLLIRYNSRDVVLGRHVQESVDWLRSHGANLRADTFGGKDPATSLQRVVEFYQHVIRSEPWVRIRAAPTGSGDLMELSFQVRSSNPLQELHWQFGDGAESTDVQPVHRYAAPGSYTVHVTGKQKKETVSRTLSVRVPANSSSVTPTKAP
jgi:dienelactone hydrolase